MIPKDERYKLIDTAELAIIIGCIHDIREKSKEHYTPQQLLKVEERLCKLLGVDVSGNKLDNG